MQRVDILHFLSLSCSYICKMSLSLRSGHLMCTYNISLWCQNTRNYIHFWLSSPWTVVIDVINDLLDTFPNNVHIMLIIEPQIEKIVLHLYKTNTINEMVQANSHQFNTHFKRLSLSATVVIIIITRLLATSRIITQYFTHLLLYNFYHQSTQNWWAIINFPILPFMAWTIRKLIWIHNSWLFEYVFQVILCQ